MKRYSGFSYTGLSLICTGVSLICGAGALKGPRTHEAIVIGMAAFGLMLFVIGILSQSHLVSLLKKEIVELRAQLRSRDDTPDSSKGISKG